jgi:hypothetical protein
MASLKKLLKKRDNLREDLEDLLGNDSYYGDDSWEQQGL